MKKKKEEIITIHKGNSLIRSKSSEYSLEQLKLLNTVYNIIQYNLDEIIQNNNTILIPFQDMLDILGENKHQNDSKNKYRYFSEKNRKILMQPLTLKEYTDETGEYYEWLDIALFHKIGVKGTSRNKILEMKLSNELIHLIKLSKTEFFTKLEIKMMNTRLRSNFQYRFYEFLKSYENLKHKYIKINLNEYNEIFEPEDKPAKTLSIAKKKVDRTLIIINEETDLKVELKINKKLKIMEFHLKNKSPLEKNLESNEKRKYSILIPRKQEIEENEMIERLLKIIYIIILKI
jgi:hypothetical protein